MKQRVFDLATILLMAVLLVVLNHFDLLERSAKFAIIPFMTFYFLGKYSVKRLNNREPKA